MPASKQVTAHAEPLTLLAVFKLFYGMHVWLQLCSPQGVALFSFIRLPPRLPRPFAGAPVYDMSLTHAERLCAVGCGFRGWRRALLCVGQLYEGGAMVWLMRGRRAGGTGALQQRGIYRDAAAVLKRLGA